MYLTQTKSKKLNLTLCFAFVFLLFVFSSDADKNLQQQLSDENEISEKTDIGSKLLGKVVDKEEEKENNKSFLTKEKLEKSMKLNDTKNNEEQNKEYATDEVQNEDDILNEIEDGDADEDADDDEDVDGEEDGDDDLDDIDDLSKEDLSEDDFSTDKLILLEYNSEQDASNAVLRILSLLGLDNITQKKHIYSPSNDTELPKLKYLQNNKEYNDFNDIANFFSDFIQKSNAIFTIYAIKNCIYCTNVLNFIDKYNLDTTKVKYITLNSLPNETATNITAMVNHLGGRVQYPVMFSSLSSYAMFESNHIMETLGVLYLKNVPSKTIHRIENKSNLQGQKVKVDYPKKFCLYFFEGDEHSHKDFVKWLKAIEFIDHVSVSPLSNRRYSKACAEKIRAAEALTNKEYNIPILFEKNVTIPRADSFNDIKQFLVGDHYRKIYEKTKNTKFYRDFTIYTIPNCKPCQQIKAFLNSTGLIGRINHIDGSLNENTYLVRSSGISVFPSLAVKNVLTFIGKDIFTFFTYLDSITEKKFFVPENK